MDHLLSKEKKVQRRRLPTERDSCLVLRDHGSEISRLFFEN